MAGRTHIEYLRTSFMFLGVIIMIVITGGCPPLRRQVKFIIDGKSSEKLSIELAGCNAHLKVEGLTYSLYRNPTIVRLQVAVIYDALNKSLTFHPENIKINSLDSIVPWCPKCDSGHMIQEAGYYEIYKHYRVMADEARRQELENKRTEMRVAFDGFIYKGEDPIPIDTVMAILPRLD